jgi:cytochrome c556
MNANQEELRIIMEKFAASGWSLIDAPAKAWLNGTGDKAALIAAIEQAEQECGSCGCEFDPLYKRALALKDAL